MIYGDSLTDGMTTDELKPGYEKVFTVIDYYDGPRKGIANYKGEPHYYDCLFDHSRDDFSNLYRLTPITSDIFQLAMEDWEIWLRWRAAFDAGHARLDSHPALPAERARYEVLKSLLDPALVTDLEKCFVKQASFDVIGEPSLPPGVLRPLQVKWSDPSDPSQRIR